jgi:hypothetical protein
MVNLRTWPAIVILPHLLCCCTTSKAPAPSAPAKTALAKRTSNSIQFGFPEGVDWNNATPTQIADAVFAAVSQNPEAAADIAVAGLQDAAKTGRWRIQPGSDGKMSVDPDPGFWSFRWLFPKRNR